MGRLTSYPSVRLMKMMQMVIKMMKSSDRAIDASCGRPIMMMHDVDGDADDDVDDYDEDGDDEYDDGDDNDDDDDGR